MLEWKVHGDPPEGALGGVWGNEVRNPIYVFFVLFCFFINLFIYLFLFLAVLGLCSVRRLSPVAASGARASHCHGLSCCGAQAPDAQAQ